jgi:hypothetical protein
MTGSDIARARVKKTASIANGGSLSGAITLEGFVLMAIQMPAAWTAADITFDGSVDGGLTFAPVFDDGGSEVKILAASAASLAGKICVNATLLEKLAALSAIKIRSGVTGATVNQVGAQRDFVFILKG